MHSDALRCTQMHSDALRCTQMHSDALRRHHLRVSGATQRSPGASNHWPARTPATRHPCEMPSGETQLPEIMPEIMPAGDADGDAPEAVAAAGAAAMAGDGMSDGADMTAQLRPRSTS